MTSNERKDRAQVTGHRKQEAEKELIKALSLPGPFDLQPETVREKKAVVRLLFEMEGPDWPGGTAGVSQEKKAAEQEPPNKTRSAAPGRE